MVDLKDSIEEAATEALTVTQTIVASLGHVLLTLEGRDFSFNGHCESAKYKYIKYPDSFRACLVQIFNGVRRAFDGAHMNMNRICVKSQHIVVDAKKAIEFMEKGTQKEWSIAQHYLQNVEERCGECVKTAASITEEFEKVAKTINELYEAYTGFIKEDEDKQKSTSLKIEVVDDEIELTKKSENNLDKRCDKGKKEYKVTVEVCFLPWKTILPKFMDDITFPIIYLAVELLKQTMIPYIQVSANKTVGSRSKTPKLMDENEISQSQEAGRSRKKKEMWRYEIRDALLKSKKTLCAVIQHRKIFEKMFQTFRDAIRERLKLAYEELHDGQEMSDDTRLMIIQESKKAQNVASVAKLISSVYVEVSTKYLLVGVNGLQSITLLEPIGDHARKEEIWRKLEEDVKEAEKGIPIIAEERRKLCMKENFEVSHNQVEAAVL